MNKINENTKKIDVLLEGKKFLLGNIHPINQIIKEIYEILLPLGYEIVKSPEIDSKENNFTKLNFSPNHTSWDNHQTFFLNENLLLRTHTSNTQSRVLSERKNQEIKIITDGSVFRPDKDDFTHTHEFKQMEGFAVGKNINLDNLKEILSLIIKKLFGEKIDFRFRPSYFPFTEPSIEVDIKCVRCEGKGCNTCNKECWIEVLGAGLIHENVLKNCGYNNKKFTGFAFGLGIERLVMIKYGIEDIRNFYLNDIRFLKQFK